MKHSPATRRKRVTVAMTMVLLGIALFPSAGLAQPARALRRGRPVLFNGLLNSRRDFFIDVPRNTRLLVFELSGGAGDADIYAGRNRPVALAAWAFSSRRPSNNEQIRIVNPIRGRWFVRVHGFAGFNNAMLVANYDRQPGGAGWMTLAARTAPVLLESLLARRSRSSDDDDDDRCGRPTRSARAAENRPLDRLRTVTLNNGALVKNLRGPGGGMIFYKIAVPANVAWLRVATSRGKGNCLLLVRRDGLPTFGNTDYSAGDPGTTQRVFITNPEAGVYYARLMADPTFSGVSIVASYPVTRAARPARTAAPSDEGARVTPLDNGVRKTGISGRRGGKKYFMVCFPDDLERLVVRTRGGTGTCGVLVRRNALPTAKTCDYRSGLTGTDHTLILRDNLKAGAYFIVLYGGTDFRGVSLLVEGRPAQSGTADQIRIVAPGDGERLATGRSHDVRWSAPAAIETVTILVSWDAGGSWMRLADLPARTPRFVWYVAAGQTFDSEGVLLRIRDKDNPATATTSRFTFFRP